MRRTTKNTHSHASSVRHSLPPASFFRPSAASLFSILFSFFFSVSVVSCVDEEEFPDTPQGNFEALWKIIDEHYCFFNYKQHEYGLDWQQVHARYQAQVNSQMTDEQLFEVLANMLSELRDGHVNLTAAHDMARYWQWYEQYPANFSDTLSRRYLGTDYKIAAGLYYKILDDNIGYIRYESFSYGVGSGNLTEILNYFLLCRGLIIDIRGNGGGDLTNAEKLASRFTNERTLVGYIQHKTGTGHSDFSDMEPRYLDPAASLRWQKPVCVLTNRHVFSAANEFTMYMKALPNVKVVGDHTGGGAGMPFSSSLPNGWTVRFSAIPMYDAQRQSTEFGIAPDYEVSLRKEDFMRGEDTIIEFARKLLAK
ncbi:MAG: S41 family peptidase [Prevotella sp.]|nr:S41 family peptidase [Prevotella sp.]